MRALLAFALIGCAGEAHDPPAGEAHFVVDAPVAGEAYVCTTVPMPPSRTLARIEWSIPKSSGLLLHHATLYAVRDPNAVVCDVMPEGATSLHVYAPGAESLTMPKGLALQIPAEATALIVQAHGARSTAGPRGEGTLRITEGVETDASARWLSVEAPVPAIRPHRDESSVTRCFVDRSTTLHFGWPHMHRIGARIEATRIQGAERASILLVSPWDFDRQRVSPLDVTLAAGDAIELSCTWSNTTADYVLPGGRSTDEMCTFGFVASPSSVSFSRCE